MAQSVFTKIINREIPAHFVYEDERCVVILDAFPAVRGQSLVIPRQEINYAFDLDDDTYVHLFKIAKMIAKASDKAFQAERTCLVVEGFEVPHVHIKLYPMTDSKQALGQLLPNGTASTNEEFAVVATQLIAAIEAMGE